MKTPFIHLHTHSHYSLLDGLSKIPDMIAMAKKYDMPALALTDHGNLYGAIEFYKECKKAEIKPIIGVEAYIATRTRFDKEPRVDAERFHLTLLAENETGYRNLMAMVTKSNMEGMYYKPRMDHDLLREHKEGVIALSGCFGSELSRALKADNTQKAEEIVHIYKSIFGEDNYFIEIMHHPGVEGLIEVNKKAVELAKRLSVPIVATQDSHYINPDDKRAHETLLAIQTGTDLGDEGKFSMDAGDFHFISTKEAYEKFKDTPEAIENTFKIAERCDIELDLGKAIFPDLGLSDKSEYDKALKDKAYEGIAWRGLKEEPEVTERIEYELDIIRGKGYSPYFLIVADLLSFSRENGILTNTRGSAAGSLVSYLIGITTVDPLAFRLPFERFLNPERPSAPDIDMDFADDRRDEVIEYSKKKYGEDRVAQIGTFGTMLARGVVRDVARALGHPYSKGDTIAKLIPMGSQGFPMTIDRAFEAEPELKKLYKNDADTREITDLGKKIEGCVRHVSVHAAGVVIAPSPLSDFVPLQLDPKGGKIITQYDMYSVSDEYGGVGLVKFDFLGIRNLSILKTAMELAKQEQGADVDIENIPLDDQRTYALLARGETMGLFQLGGGGMTRYLMELRPTTIDDINAMVALYRPGPMAFIPDYIERKRNPARVTYLDPRLQKILEPTFGILIYQDDILLIVTQLAGYSWGEADKFRKAVGKKIPAEMAAQKEKFFKGCIKGGMSENKTQKLWDMIETFAAYGFNKAHAASYGRVAYQTAYMKANYPVEYMCAVLTEESGDVEKIATIISECERMNLPVLPPDINQSYGHFTVIRDNNKTSDVSEEAGEIRFGLYSIKNFGEGIADTIIEERDKNGKFTSLTDFLERIRNRNLNKKTLEALIMSGAMDNVAEEYERGQMLANIDTLLNYNRECENAPKAEDTLFGAMGTELIKPTLRIQQSEPATTADKLRWEKELLGLYVSGHPLERVRDKLESRTTNIRKTKGELKEGMLTVVAGLVEEVKPILTKSGDKMLFTTIADFSDKIEVVVFPRTFAEYKDVLLPESTLAIKGRISHRNGSVSVIADAVKEL